MADIFISYAHVDSDKVREIVQHLEKEGLSVWWDIALRSGDAYGDVIETELTQAKCVLAVWSRNARNSTWVKAEASLANDSRKLVQVVLHRDVKPPLPFNIIHFEPIYGGPNPSDENWRQLLTAVRERVGGAAQAERAPAKAPNPFDLSTVLSLLSAASLGLYLAALNAPGLAEAMTASAGGVIADPVNLPLYAGLVFAAGAALATVRRIAAVANAER
ncbi:MAG: TIR domain-containing protein [Alphaproteobacteria bacterium]|nr:TIR domain-containing protein [Alphaproteobacteria bacterium]